MKKNISKYIKFITIISLFTQLNAMEQDNNKRKLSTNINNNNSNKKPRAESEIDIDNENNQHCTLLELPAEMQRLILFHTIENIINDSSDIFNTVSDASRFIYNISLTHRNFYDFKRDLFKHTASCLKDKFTKDRIYTLPDLIHLLKRDDGQEETHIAKTIISDIYYDSQYGYPPKDILSYIIEKDYKKALKVAKFYNNINPIINNTNNKSIIDNTKDPLITHPDIKNAIELALNNNDINNLKKYLEILKSYLNNPYDINYIITSNSVSLLIEAIIKNKIEVIKVLLEYNIDINAIYKNFTYSTALQVAILQGNINILKLLLEKNANPDIQGIYNYTPLIVSSLLQNREEIVIELLKYTRDINLKDNNRYTALIYAAKNGHTDIVQLLLQEYANVNMQNNDSYTALTFAAQNGHTDIVRLLLDKDANVNIQGNKYGNTALISAAHNGHTDIVRLLIQKSANVDMQSNNRNTALIFAAYHGHTDIVRLLLQENANINMQNNNGCTALIFAAYRGHTDIVRLLLQKHADVNIQNNNRNTALMLARANNHTDIVQLLIQAGAVE